MSGQTKLMLPSGGSLTIAAADSASNNTVTIPAITGTLVDQTNAQTLSNKTLTNTPSVSFSDGTSQTAASIGFGQTWQYPTRALATTYTNSTGRPITVMITANTSQSAPASHLKMYINGTYAVAAGNSYATNYETYFVPATFVVPNGATYSASSFNSCAVAVWAELR